MFYDEVDGEPYIFSEPEYPEYMKSSVKYIRI